MRRQQFKYSISDFSSKRISVAYKSVRNDFRLHWHDCCELELILSGRGSQVLNDTEYPLVPGTLYMLTEADCHSIRVTEPMQIIGIMFDEKHISPSVYERVLTREMLGQNLTAVLEGKAFRAVHSLMEALMCADSGENDLTESELGEMYVGHIIDCILIELLGSFAKSSPEPSRSRADALGKSILYLHRHFTEPVTLADLAELTHLSRSYFSELFRESTGMTFKSYLIGLRLRSACRLLANTSMSVTDICFASGFESFSHFMRTFKARFGVTPLRFREANGTQAQDKTQ